MQNPFDPSKLMLYSSIDGQSPNNAASKIAFYVVIAVPSHELPKAYFAPLQFINHDQVKYHIIGMFYLMGCRATDHQLTPSGSKNMIENLSAENQSIIDSILDNIQPELRDICKLIFMPVFYAPADFFQSSTPTTGTIQ